MTSPLPLTDREIARLLCGCIGTLLDLTAVQGLRRAVSGIHHAELWPARNTPLEQSNAAPRLPGEPARGPERLSPNPTRALGEAEARRVLEAFLVALVPVSTLPNVRRAVAWVHLAEEYWQTLASDDDRQARSKPRSRRFFRPLARGRATVS